MDTVIVKVNSDMNFPCSVMSIQDIQVPTFSTQFHSGHYCYFLFLLTSSQCPVYDLDNNVAFTGMYQTMTKKGAITVQVLFEVFYMVVANR